MVALFQLFIAVLGLHSISAKVGGDLNHHNNKFEQRGVDHVQTSAIPLQQENLIEGQSSLERRHGGRGRRVKHQRGRRSGSGVVNTGKFRGQVVRTRKSGGRTITVTRAHVRRQRAVRGGRVTRFVKKVKGHTLTTIVSKSSGSGWTRKVIVTNDEKQKGMHKNGGKNKKWWKKNKGNYKPLKWKVRGVKLKVREFRGGYARFRGKWLISKNGKMIRPSSKARPKLAKKLNRKFSRVLRKITKNRQRRHFRKLAQLTYRQLGRRERMIQRRLSQIRRILHVRMLSKNMHHKQMLKHMRNLRNVIMGLRHMLNKARKSPCIKKNWKHLRHLKQITCSNRKLRWLSKHGKSWATKELKKRKR